MSVTLLTRALLEPATQRLVPGPVASLLRSLLVTVPRNYSKATESPEDSHTH